MQPDSKPAAASGSGEQAASERAESFRAAFDASPIGMAFTAPDGAFLRVNPAFCDLLGYSEAELLASSFQAVTHPDDLPRNLELHEQAVAGELDAYQIEKRYVRRDGRELWAHLTVSAVREQGSPTCFVTQVLDISERRRAEADLRQREAILRSVASAGERLLRAPYWRLEMPAVLRELGEAAGVSRAYLFERRTLPGQALMLGQVDEWCAPGVESQIDNPELEAYTPAPEESRWVEALEAGNMVAGHTHEFPPRTRALLERQGIRALVMVPIHVDGHFWGFLGFDECEREREWRQAEQEALRAAAGALGAAIYRHAVDEARREAEERYRMLVEQLPLTTYVDHLDDIGTPLYVSPQIEQMLGYPVSQWIEDTGLFLRIVHPEDRERVAEGDWPATDGPHRLEYRMIARDGREVWVHDEYLIVRDETGRRLYAQGYLVDITDRKRMEDELARTHQLLHAAVHASPLGIIGTDVELNVTLWNPAAERIYGWSGAEAIGGPLPTRPPNREEEAAWIREAARSSDWISGYETERLRKDGTAIDVSLSVAPLRDESGDVIGYVSVHEDITERKLAEAALRESEERFRAVFESALDGLALLDDEHRVVDANPQMTALVDRGREEVVGRDMLELLPPHQHEAFEQRWRELMARGEVLGEWEFATDQATRQTEFAARANIAPGRHILVVRDVTERKQLEAQLIRSQRLEAVGRLAGGVAHDFNNLLTAISGYAEFLAESLPEEDRLRRDVAEIQRAADRAAALVRQLLAFSRRQLVRPRALDLNAVVRDAEDLVERLLGEDVMLVAELAAGLDPIHADPVQIEQVIVELAINARDAMPRGGSLTLRTEPAGDRSTVRLTVSDTGAGMDADTIAHAFEPFFTTKGAGHGTGLGLSTVYGVVAQSGGTVEVNSAPGRGTTFTLTFPTRPGELGDRPTGQVGALATGRTILLVEDEDTVRELACRVLEEAGYEVVTAASGEEALELAPGCIARLALVVTDMRMPGIGGHELTESLRAQRPGLPVLFTSGYTDREPDIDPPDLFLAKPFTPATLREHVLLAIESRPAPREQAES